jgi:acyl carrier protein
MSVEVEQLFRQLFMAIMQLDESVDLDSFTQDSAPGWDSLRHAELIITIQKKFKIRFEMREILIANSYKSISNMVAAKTLTIQS